MHEGEKRALTAIRRLLPATSGDALRCTRLGGGLAARSYLVASPRGQWVVRLPHETDVGEVLEAAAEHALTARAADAGLAPPVAASDPAAGVLITRFLRGARPWSEADARRPENVRRLAAHLRKLHALPADIPAFKPTRAAARYLADCDTAQGEASAWAEELRRAAQAFESRYAPTAPCHNDLAAANLLDDGRLYLVDFEYAVLGAPILDLANAAAMNDYDRELQRMLLDAYFQNEPAEYDKEDLDEALRMSRLLWRFWAEALARRAAGPRPYERFADRMTAALRRTGPRAG